MVANEAQTLPKLFVLPKDDGLAESRILSFLHPQSGKPTRFYFNPRGTLCEIVKIGAPRPNPRSCLLAQNIRQAQADVAPSEEGELAISKDGSVHADLSKGYVLQSPEVFMATPIDPLFLVLEALSRTGNSNGRSSERMFLTLDDHFFAMAETSPQFPQLVRHESIRSALESRVRAVCDVVDAGDDSCYRLNTDKLCEVLLEKAERMIVGGLPPSLEQRFVTKALEAPVTIIEEQDHTETTVQAASDGPASAETESTPSLTTSTSTLSDSSMQTSESSVASQTTQAMSPSNDTPSPQPDLLRLLRLRTALNYLRLSYLPASLSHLSPASSIDFNPLDTHLAKLEVLRQQAIKSRQDTEFSRKRTFEDEDEHTEKSAAKRRKEDEEKKKKLNESRAMKDLKKVNVTGMKKMSDFFRKPLAKKA